MKVINCIHSMYCIGVQKGDMVAMYMPMAIELVVAMFACARIGAIHSVVVSSYPLYSTQYEITFALYCV